MDVRSQTSFIDLSDEDEPVASTLTLVSEVTVREDTVTLPSSAQSIMENMSKEELLEEERRRRREKLAKLHRHLGSRVPINLVLGGDHADSTPHDPSMDWKASSSDADNPPARMAWPMRRRSSSAAFPPAWSDAHQRRKEDLDTKEKALNVRRAQKMEKVFGVAPPQTLYHTRHTPSLSLTAVPIAAKSYSSPSALFSTTTTENIRITQNPTKARKEPRPSTADSSTPLLRKGRNSTASIDDFNNGYDNTQRPFGSYGTQNAEGSAVYNHYQHSMKSLNDIMDRDDCESLVELHHYLNGDGDEYDPDAVLLDDDFTPRPRKLSDSSTKTEVERDRRHSFPASLSGGASILSIESTATRVPEDADFQVRRRRAAKLTQFFGVHYRELINDVLDNLENGLENESKRGTLLQSEMEDLVHRLRQLKVRREGLF